MEDYLIKNTGPIFAFLGLINLMYLIHGFSQIFTGDWLGLISVFANGGACAYLVYCAFKIRKINENKG